MSASTPLVTVGIPTYNRPEGLERTLDNICKQTYKNLAIIVSDNCSTNPDVLPVLKKYAGQDERVTFIVQEKNLSLVPNFQYLLDNATGKYFMWAADDDQWAPDFIEVCVKAMEVDDDLALTIPDVIIVGENGEQKPSGLNRSFVQANLLNRSFNFIKSKMVNKYFLCGLYRNSMVKNIPFHNSWGGEHLFLYENISKGKFLYLKGQSAFYYYQGGSSKTTASIRKAFNITSRFYFFDAYVLKYLTYQFGFKHLSVFQKIGLFLTNGAGLVCNEEYILYYILIKKPIRNLLNSFKNTDPGSSSVH